MKSIAIYARVSSEQQAQQATVESQIAALKQRVEADGHLVLPQDIYVEWVLAAPRSCGQRSSVFGIGLQKEVSRYSMYTAQIGLLASTLTKCCCSTSFAGAAWRRYS